MTRSAMGICQTSEDPKAPSMSYAQGCPISGRLTKQHLGYWRNDICRFKQLAKRSGKWKTHVLLVLLVLLLLLL
ncbi:hypothetical protein HD806DRAFT_512284 [Xylariaceae sp. AK1471]|nr:hypothetical protein HD806DRAFT_512284 [Xylariaceae sp. AK1471]